MTVRMNQTVTYLSLGPNARTFTGRVHSVHEDRAVVKHETAPHYTTVAVNRLEVVAPARHRFAGANA